MPVVVLLAVAGTGLHFLGDSQAATVCTVSDKLVNSCRPWLGAAVGKYPQAASNVRAQAEYHEQRIGRKLDIIHSYHPVGSSQLSADDKYIATRQNTYLFTNWKPAGNWSLAAGSNADVNSDIDQMAGSVKSLGTTKIFMTIHHEAENDVSGGASGCAVNSYKGTYGTPSDYRAMWKNIQNRFAAKGVTNVVWVWDLINYEPWDCMIDDMYPGNSRVDWIMFNAYGGPSQTNYSANVKHFYDLLINTNSSANNYLSKPWGIVEWNTRNSSEPEGIAYYNKAKASLDAAEFPRLKAHMIFDSVGPEGNENRVAYTGTGAFSQAKQNAYTAFARDPRFTDAFYIVTPPPVDNAPIVALTAPRNAATVKGAAVTVSANASDDKGVSNLTFSYKTLTAASWTRIGTPDTAAPYAVTWDTTSLQNGTYSVRAVATDTAGQVATTSAVTVTVSNGVSGGGDTTPPAVSITVSPLSVRSGGKVKAVVNAADNKGVTKVEIYSDGVLKGTDTATPYEVSWPTESPGVKPVTARAYDAAGNVKISVPVKLTVTAAQAVHMPGDINDDGKANRADYVILEEHYGQKYPPADLDKDGIVGTADLLILLKYWKWWK
ncbi:MAG: hypothetical protein JWP13_921 [Candidatus Saccharibacteria bacterium]|nr:hypothetical protein [Candidatus Saccharibacteria bacterium]